MTTIVCQRCKPHATRCWSIKGNDRASDVAFVTGPPTNAGTCRCAAARTAHSVSEQPHALACALQISRLTIANEQSAGHPTSVLGQSDDPTGLGSVVRRQRSEQARLGQDLSGKPIGEILADDPLPDARIARPHVAVLQQYWRGEQIQRFRLRAGCGIVRARALSELEDLRRPGVVARPPVSRHEDAPVEKQGGGRRFAGYAEGSGRG
jgi:hypothetical protein